VTAPGQIEVRHLGQDRFAIEVRKHTISVDQPADDGGTDTAPTPTELFVAGLASCVAHYAHRYLTRHGLSSDGLQVTATYEIALRPTRVGQVRIDIVPPPSLPSSRREALLAVASHCTVHNSLTQPPSVDINLMTEVLSSNGIPI
jgi:putative redox protein